MELGVVSRSFPDLNNREIAEFLGKNDFKWTELCFASKDANYWNYNGRSDLSSLSDERAKVLIEDYRDNEVEVSVIGVFTNLLEADDGELEKNLEYFERHMDIAAKNSVPMVATECGFLAGQRGINADRYESDFDRLKESLSWLLDKASSYGVDLALEPCVLDVVPSAKRMKDLIDQLGSPRLKVLLDPANLIANSSEEDMFNYLALHIGYFHGKDRKVNDAYGRVVGDGDIDWPLFLRLYREKTPGIPFIFEYVNIDNVLDVRDRTREFARF